MADKEEKAASKKGRVTEDQRFRYIGFDVFPGKPKDLFKNDAEKEKLIGTVQQKRESGDVLREHCSLFEERVSLTDRLILTVASVFIIATLFVPWFAVYNEIEETASTTGLAEAPAEVALVDSMADSTAGDSAAIAGEMLDSAGMLATTEGSEPAPPGEPAEAAEGAETAVEGEELVMEETPGAGSAAGSGEEIIHSYVAKKKIHREYERMSGIGMFAGLASVGSYVFSSGFILIVTAVLLLVYAILCVVLPAYTLFGLYGTKGDADMRALKLKKILRLNWYPVIIFVVVLFLSFLGAEYGFDGPRFFTSIGDSYGIDVLLGSISWGVVLTLAAYVLVAVKGVEI